MNPWSRSSAIDASRKRSRFAKFVLVVAALAGCREKAAAQVSLPVAVAPGEPASPGDAATSAPPAVPSVGAVPFVPEKVTGEGHAMGTHLAYAAFTTPTLDAPHVRSLFEAATA